MVVRKINLVWRAGTGNRRTVIGEFFRSASEGVSFRYDQENVKKAEASGFSRYPDFPDLNKTYSKGVLEVISQRLIQVQNPQNNRHLSFWEADKEEYDVFDRVAFTQGLLATDNFEFLGVYNPSPGFSFISDLSGVSFQELDPSMVEEGDRVLFAFEPTNDFDSRAVVVKTLSGLKLGYIKTVHNLFIHRAKSVRLTVKSISKNGTVKKIYLRISVPEKP